MQLAHKTCSLLDTVNYWIEKCVKYPVEYPINVQITTGLDTLNEIKEAIQQRDELLDLLENCVLDYKGLAETCRNYNFSKTERDALETADYIRKAINRAKNLTETKGE